MTDVEKLERMRSAAKFLLQELLRSYVLVLEKAESQFANRGSTGGAHLHANHGQRGMERSIFGQGRANK